MREHRVAQSTATNMLGPSLTAEAVCPLCGKNNTLLHTEGYNSPVKCYAELVCKHLAARELDEDFDNPVFIFRESRSRMENGDHTVDERIP